MLEDVKRAGMLIFKVTDPAEGDQNQRTHVRQTECGHFDRARTDDGRFAQGTSRLASAAKASGRCAGGKSFSLSGGRRTG
jgi:hypothetical protein